MLVTPKSNRRNRNQAFAVAGGAAAMSLAVGWFFPLALLSLGVAPFVYWFVRRRCVRRLEIMEQPFPDSWEKVLQSHVAFFRALPDPGKERFRQLVKIFLDEVRVTGIETEVDDTVRVLVAASAAIPIFGFDDWEYHRLGEVLIYPRSFGEDYQTTGGPDENWGGMVGVGQQRGVMILSKPWLMDGFDNPSNSFNVGVHEFAHLVEREDAENGLPPEVPWRAVKDWVQYVARELAHPSKNRSYIRDYAYTNDREFFATLAEYFFKSPELLKEKDPRLYGMLQDVFHQDTASLLKQTFAHSSRYDPNAPCPCRSGKKFKICCRLKGAKRGAAKGIETQSTPLADSGTTRP
jgi:Mlc titration factor MtfA (ptsG expression regulator)